MAERPAAAGIPARRAAAHAAARAAIYTALAVLGALPAPGWTQQRGADVPAVASGAQKSVCVNAEIDGVRALSYDCLSRQLAPTPAASASDNTGNVAEGLATAPSNRVGTFNYSGESIRFGSNWGKSVYPQRPPPVPAVPLR